MSAVNVYGRARGCGSQRF